MNRMSLLCVLAQFGPEPQRVRQSALPGSFGRARTLKKTPILDQSLMLSSLAQKDVNWRGSGSFGGNCPLLFGRVVAGHKSNPPTHTQVNNSLPHLVQSTQQIKLPKRRFSCCDWVTSSFAVFFLNRPDFFQRSMMHL